MRLKLTTMIGKGALVHSERILGLRVQSYNSTVLIDCALVTGKSRVAPIKVITIPRLELTAAVVSVAVSSILKEECSYTNIEDYFWTDSTIVLGYISNEACCFNSSASNKYKVQASL